VAVLQPADAFCLLDFEAFSSILSSALKLTKPTRG